MSKLLSVNHVSGQKAKESRSQRYEREREVLPLVTRSILTYGDQHLLKLSIGNSTMSVSQMIIAGILMYTSFPPKTRPSTSIGSMKLGYLLNIMFASKVYALTEVENI